MAKVKTIELVGAEVEVSELGGQNVAVQNLGDKAIYASVYPNIEAGADNVIEIPARSGVVVHDAHGKVYLLGMGKAQLTGTDYAYPNFNVPSSSASSGGGGNVVLLDAKMLSWAVVDSYIGRRIEDE